MGMRDRPIAQRSPWQSRNCKQLVDPTRRECVDDVLVRGNDTVAIANPLSWRVVPAATVGKIVEQFIQRLGVLSLPTIRSAVDRCNAHDMVAQ
jgi:hypothetical protein